MFESDRKLDCHMLSPHNIKEWVSLPRIELKLHCLFALPFALDCQGRADPMIGLYLIIFNFIRWINMSHAYPFKRDSILTQLGPNLNPAEVDQDWNQAQFQKVSKTYARCDGWVVPHPKSPLDARLPGLSLV